MHVQSYLTLFHPVDWGPPGSSVHVQLRFPTPRDLSDLGIEPVSLASPALAGGFFTTEPLETEKGGHLNKAGLC